MLPSFKASFIVSESISRKVRSLKMSDVDFTQGFQIAFPIKQSQRNPAFPECIFLGTVSITNLNHDVPTITNIT